MKVGSDRIKGKQTLRKRQAKYLVINLALQIIILLVITISFRYVGKIKEKDVKKLRSIHSHLVEEIQTKLQDYSLNLGNMALELSDCIEDNQNSSQPNKEILNKLLELQGRTKATGIYFLPVSENSEAAPMEDIYIRDVIPNICHVDNSDIRLHIGSSRLAKEHGIPIDSTWKLKLKEKIHLALYQKPLEAYEKTGDIRNSTYFSDILQLDQKDVRLLTLSLPIADDRGKVLGILGIELTEAFIKESLSIENAPFANVMTLLTSSSLEQVKLKDSILCGSYADIIRQQADVISFVPEKKDILKLNSEAEPMSAITSDIILYNPDAYFTNQEWKLLTIVPNEHLEESAVGLKYVLAVILIISIVVNLLVLLVWVYKLCQPINKLARNLEITREHPGGEYSSTNIVEFDNILDYIKERGQTENTSISPDLFEEFIEQTKSLTPTEKEVFAYYAKGCSIPQVAEQMFISMNTLKVHNKHIYAKLNIGSKDELDLYIRFIRESHMFDKLKSSIEE